MRNIQLLLLLASVASCYAFFDGGCQKEKYYACQYKIRTLPDNSIYLCQEFQDFTQCIYDNTQGCASNFQEDVLAKWITYRDQLPFGCIPSTTWRFDSSQSGLNSADSSGASEPSPSGLGDSGFTSSRSGTLGSSGSYMEIWQWMLIVALTICCCSLSILTGLASRRRRRRFAPYDPYYDDEAGCGGNDYGYDSDFPPMYPSVVYSTGNQGFY